MTAQQRSFLIRLALLGLLVGLAELTAGEDEDFYMQELLTRDLYNQVQIQETSEASIPDGRNDPFENPTKKLTKEKNTGTKKKKIVSTFILSSIISISSFNYAEINIKYANTFKSGIIHCFIDL